MPPGYVKFTTKFERPVFLKAKKLAKKEGRYLYEILNEALALSLGVDWTPLQTEIDEYKRSLHKT